MSGFGFQRYVRNTSIAVPVKGEHRNDPRYFSEYCFLGEDQGDGFIYQPVGNGTSYIQHRKEHCDLVTLEANQQLLLLCDDDNEVVAWKKVDAKMFNHVISYGDDDAVYVFQTQDGATAIYRKTDVVKYDNL